MTSRINEIIENFGFLEDWEDRYRYLIELGKDLPQLSESETTEDNRVKGCASQVWVVTSVDHSGSSPFYHSKAKAMPISSKASCTYACALFGKDGA